jgi:hypothetical protein
MIYPAYISMNSKSRSARVGSAKYPNVHESQYHTFKRISRKRELCQLALHYDILVDEPFVDD